MLSTEKTKKCLSVSAINAAKTIKRRKEMLSQYNCRACDHNDPTVIEWHHLDPSTKELKVWRCAWNEERFWNEILKCVPLCPTCHVKIHQDQLCLIPQISLSE
jgi:hypothetical protein